MSRIFKLLLAPAMVIALLGPASSAAQASTPLPTGGVTGPIAVAANGAALIYTVRWTCEAPYEWMSLILRQVRRDGGVTTGTQPLNGTCDGTTHTMHVATMSDMEFSPGGTSLPYVRPWSTAPVLTILNSGGAYRVVRPTVANPQRPLPQVRITSVKVVARGAALAVAARWQCPTSQSVSYEMTAVQRIARERVQSSRFFGSVDCSATSKTTTVLIPADTDSFGAPAGPWRADNSVLLLPYLSYCSGDLCYDGWQIVRPS